MAGDHDRLGDLSYRPGECLKLLVDAELGDLASAGWKVFAGVRKSEGGERLVASVEGDVARVLLDVVNSDHVRSVLAQIESEVGRLNGLVNNAGIAVGGWPMS